MRNNRVVSIAAVLGILIVVVTFVGAAKLAGEEKGDKDVAKSSAPVSSGSGVVVFGYVDINNGAGLLHLFPNTFPQPCKVAKIHFKEGQDVKKDDLLIEFEDPQCEFKIQQAKAGLEKAKAAHARTVALLNQANLGPRVQKAAIVVQQLTVKSKEAELEGAKIDLKHQEDNFGKIGANNDSGVMSAKKKVTAAELALEAEKKKVEGLEKIDPVPFKIDEARAGVDEAKAAVSLQESQLAEAENYKRQLFLRAPANGRIERSHVTEGLWFGAQSRMAALEFLPRGQIIVRAEVDQEWASRVREGQNAKIQDESNPELKWSGKVIHVSDCFLPKRSNSGVPDMLGGSEARILECIVSIDHFDKVDLKTSLRILQKVKVSIGFE